MVYCDDTGFASMENDTAVLPFLNCRYDQMYQRGIQSATADTLICKDETRINMSLTQTYLIDLQLDRKQICILLSSQSISI